MRYAGIDDQYTQFDTADVLLQSIPYDGTSTWGKGSDRGFAAFLDASDNMELYDIETDTEVYRRGVHILDEISGFSSPQHMYESVYSNVKHQLTFDKFLTYFGGEHSVSIGIIKAFYERYDQLTVLQLDAHADLRPSYQGTPYNHACAMYDASKHTNLIQVGIRSMDRLEGDHMDRTKVFFADQIHGGSNWITDSLALMTNDVYLSIDLDVFDPSIMPATGTPEPGGLQWYTVINYLREVFRTKNVVGFDIVELAPIEGLHAPQFLAAKLYYKLLSYKFSS